MSVQVDKSEVDAALKRLHDSVANDPRAMTQVALVLAQFVRNTFRQQVDPWGLPWPELSSVTIAQRERLGIRTTQKLFQSGALFDSIHSESDATSATVTEGEGLVYAAVQQFGNPANLAWGRGSAPIPPRPTFPMRSPTELAFPEAWLQAVLDPIRKAIEDAVR